MERILLLDLEGTVIDDWWNRALVNTEEVAAVVSQGWDRVGIFSFAIHNNEDRSSFRRSQGWWEKVVGHPIDPDLIFTVEEMSVDVQRERGLRFVDDRDFFDFFNKEMALITLAPRWFGGMDVTLVDDTVRDGLLVSSSNPLFSLRFSNPFVGHCIS